MPKDALGQQCAVSQGDWYLYDMTVSEQNYWRPFRMCLDFYLHNMVSVCDMLVEMAEGNRIPLHGLPLHPSEEVPGDDREQKKEIKDQKVEPLGPTCMSP